MQDGNVWSILDIVELCENWFWEIIDVYDIFWIKKSEPPPLNLLIQWWLLGFTCQSAVNDSARRC